VGKRKKVKKKKTKVLPWFSPEEEGLLNSFLENLKDTDLTNIKDQIPSPQFAQALLERVPSDPETIDLILAVRDAFDQKNVRKAVKKTIYRLRQRGISVPEMESRKAIPSILRAPESVEPSAYLGPIDGTGSRGVLIIIPQIPKGVDVGIGAVNYEEGIVYFLYGKYSKKQAKEVNDLFFDQSRNAVEASLSHAATILEKAYKKDEGGLGESSEGYLRLRPWILDNLSLLDHPVIYDLIPPQSISEEILTDSKLDKLLGHELMETWIIDPERIEPTMGEILKAEDSPILVSEEQKTSRINEIKEKTIAELYPYSKRQLMKDSLEEMAYLFYKLDDEEYARLCLLAASSMDEKDSPLRINPFLKALTERSIDYYMGMTEEIAKSEEREDDLSPSIIIP